MTPAQFNEYQRQADEIEREKQRKENLTAVEWFYEQIIQKDNLNTIRLGGTKVIDKLYLQAKDMEESQAISLPEGPQGKVIPVLSDEEIKNYAYKEEDSLGEILAFIRGCTWYREQLKQKQ